MHKTPDGVAAGVIGQMPGTLADAHLEFVRVEAAQEHIDIKVGFHHDGFGFGGPGHGFFRDVAQVGHQDKKMAFAADGVADRLRSVVRYLEVLRLEAFCYCVPLFRLQITPATGDLESGEGMAGQGFVQHRRRIDRLGEALADGAEVADMVAVVMGDEDGLEAVEVQGYALQNLLHPADAHACVDENARRGLPRFFAEKQVAVAATAAGKTQEANQFRSSSQYREITL